MPSAESKGRFVFTINGGGSHLGPTYDHLYDFLFPLPMSEAKTKFALDGQAFWKKKDV